MRTHHWANRVIPCGTRPTHTTSHERGIRSTAARGGKRIVIYISKVVSVRKVVSGCCASKHEWHGLPLAERYVTRSKTALRRLVVPMNSTKATATSCANRGWPSWSVPDWTGRNAPILPEHISVGVKWGVK